MDKYIQEIQLRWSDFDANLHVRHSAYYDFAALARINCLEQCGLTFEMMREGNFGPVLFREECLFKKEIRYHDKIFVEVLVSRAKKDFYRFSIDHLLTKGDGTLAATITVDAAFFDRNLRKIITLPDQAREGLAQMPRSPDFSWID